MYFYCWSQEDATTITTDSVPKDLYMTTGQRGNLDLYTSSTQAYMFDNQFSRLNQKIN
ncbi:hypothetical protein [Maribacter sp. ACAM166]|uniref:hypothetical protein n=1 Tax=Maribacter sp. ACAM166 TaxID=2508996 RepID=UPI0014856471|nr:hypothetical protein [Maribacter sp. ACAM166]